MRPVSLVVTVVLVSLSALAYAELPLSFHPPFGETFDRAYVQGAGVAQAAVHNTGGFSLHVSATDPEDRATVAGSWEIPWHSQTASFGEDVQATFTLSHWSGADGLEWWGQLCSNTVATPYAILPDGTRHEGQPMRLDGTAVPRASEQLLEALELREGRQWISEEALDAADALQVAPEGERSTALFSLLRTLDRELTLVMVVDALGELGYLRQQQVTFTFPHEAAGLHIFGLTIECRASPQQPGINIAWSAGRLQELRLTAP